MKISWQDIRRKLKHCNERDLVGMIGDLYKLNKENKYYIHAKFFDDKATFNQYKEIITKSLIFEPFEAKPKLSVARKVITDYKKANDNIQGLLDLMLHYLDCGTYMANRYGYYENGFYGSMRSMFKSSVKEASQLPEKKDMYLDKLSVIAI